MGSARSLDLPLVASLLRAALGMTVGGIGRDSVGAFRIESAVALSVSVVDHAWSNPLDGSRAVESHASKSAKGGPSVGGTV